MTQAAFLLVQSPQRQQTTNAIVHLLKKTERCLLSVKISHPYLRGATEVALNRGLHPKTAIVRAVVAIGTSGITVTHASIDAIARLDDTVEMATAPTLGGRPPWTELLASGTTTIATKKMATIAIAIVMAIEGTGTAMVADPMIASTIVIVTKAGAIVMMKTIEVIDAIVTEIIGDGGVAPLLLVTTSRDASSETMSVKGSLNERADLTNDERLVMNE